MKSTLFASTLAAALTATSFGQVEVFPLGDCCAPWDINWDGTTLSFYSLECTGYTAWDFYVYEETTVTYQVNWLLCAGVPIVDGPFGSAGQFATIMFDWIDQGQPDTWSGTFTLEPGIYDYITFYEFQGTLTFGSGCEAGTDTDGDGVVDCNDGCPTDPNKIDPGLCGCGVEDPVLDQNDDGIVDVNDLLTVLGNYGNNCSPADPECPGVPGDTDGNNIVDVDDILNLLEQFGQVEQCPTSGSNPQDLEIIVEKVEQDVLQDFTTYRLYAQMVENFSVHAVYGTFDEPLVIETNTNFYQNEFAGPSSQDLVPPLFPFFPEMEWDSYITIGFGDNSQNDLFYILDTNGFESGGSIITDNGGWFVIPTGTQGEDIEGKVLLAQLTVPTGDEVWGTLNLQGSDDLGQPFNQTLSFSSSDQPGCEPDTDGDGVNDCLDNCPNDPNKSEPGQCGCGEADTDSDDDGTADCNDAFPDDPNESADSDGDGVGDNSDAFPEDPNESVDSDGDGVGDNSDGCPNDPNKPEPGNCGCGVPETDVFGDLDCDGDYDIDDARLAMATFGIEEAEEDTCPADVDGDGSIGFSDVLIILNDWGACP
jgi:hypothetical protein